MSGPILVVEDDDAVLHAVTRNLQIRGHSVSTAETVESALRTLEADRPVLVILDIDLPDGSGWDVVRAVRRDGDGRIPVIVVSALRPNQRLAGELQCAAVLEKPFPMESLLRLVDENLSNNGEASPTS